MKPTPGPFRGVLGQLGPQRYDLRYAGHGKYRQLSSRYPGAPEKPEDPDSYDICGCRSNALEQSAAPQGLPVFNWTDELVDIPHYVPGFDFYVINGRLVWSEAVEIQLQIGAVDSAAVRRAVKASSHVSAERYAKACRLIRHCFEVLPTRCPECLSRIHI